MRRFLTLLLWIILSSCASTKTLQSSGEFKDECFVVADNTDRVASISIGSTSTQNADERIQQGSSEEQFLMRQLYETLTWIDCTNTIRIGLAASWRGTDNDRDWTFIIRPDARYWNGVAITSDEIVSQWAGLIDSIPDIVSLRAVTSSELRFILREPDADFPRLVADPNFSVSRSAPGIDWKIGSGPFRVESVRVSKSFEGANAVTKTIRTISDTDTIRPVSLVFHSSENTDARDFITDGVDVLITVDPQASRFASESGNYTDYSLPWDRSYVVVWGLKGEAIHQSEISYKRPADLPDNIAEMFTNNIAPVDARAGTVPEWYPEFESCSFWNRSTSGASFGADRAPADVENVKVLRRIVYDESDSIARALAERLSALSSTSPADRIAAEELGKRLPGWTETDEMIPAVPVAPKTLSDRMNDGSDLYYVLPFPRRVLDHCSIHVRAYSSHGILLILYSNDEFGFLPLIDTRRHLFYSSAVFGLSLDWFGNLRFVP